jgi:hypothetical protein
MKVSVTFDPGPLRRSLEDLGADATRAEVRALNRAIESTKVQARRALAADTGLAQKFVDRSLGVTRATFQNRTAILEATGQRIPLAAFQARQTARGVTYRLGRGRGIILSGFLADMRSGHRGVFRRIPLQGPLNRRRRRKLPAVGELMAGRLPIKERFGPSLPRVFVNATIQATLQRYALDLLQKNLAHEIDFIARGGRRAS